MFNVFCITSTYVRLWDILVMEYVEIPYLITLDLIV